MKRNFLAIAIPALLIAGTANASVEIWNHDGNKLNLEGRARAANHITKDKFDRGDHSDIRLGMTGETQISDSLTGYARGEWQANSITGAKGSWESDTRYAFAGLNFGDIGSLDYGRNDGLIRGISARTDILPEFGGDSSSMADKYYILSNRHSKLVTYRNNNLFGLVSGLDFALQYADPSEEKDTNGKIISRTREAYAASFDYAILDTGVSIAGAYADTSGKNNHRTWASGLKYDANDILLAANYFQAKDKEDIKASKNYWGVELVAQYGIDFQVGRLIPSVAYIQHKQKDVKGDTVKYVDVGATYEFNQNLAAVVDYKINLLKEKNVAGDDKSTTKDGVGVGLVYQF